MDYAFTTGGADAALLDHQHHQHQLAFDHRNRFPYPTVSPVGQSQVQQQQATQLAHHTHTHHSQHAQAQAHSLAHTLPQTALATTTVAVATTAATATAAATSGAPSSALNLSTMSPNARQSLSPGASWLPQELAGVSMHSPGSNSPGGVVSSPEDLQAQSPGYHSAASSPQQQQQHSPFQAAVHPHPHGHGHAHSHSHSHSLQLQHQHHQHQPQHQHQHQHSHSHSVPNARGLLTDWTLQQHALHQHQQHAATHMSHFVHAPSAPMMGFPHYHPNFQQSPLEYMPATLPQGIPATMAAATQGPMDAGMHAFSPADMPPVDDCNYAMPWSMGMAAWQDVTSVMNYPDGMPRVGNMGSHSPTGTCLEVLSLNSSDNEWTAINAYPRYDFPQQHQQQHSQNAAVFNPGQTLHLRTHSDASQSDRQSTDIGSFEEIVFPPHSPFSLASDSADSSGHHSCGEQHSHHRRQSPSESISPTALIGPMSIRSTSAITRPMPNSSSSSVSSSTSPPARATGTRKSPTAKTTRAIIRKVSNKKDGSGEKKVGRRKGPLLPEQRKQAGEIRKLRACLRCKFLKKTCDKGDPCTGCQPSHARLWQVPCTRIDIKDIGFFMKDWRADYERHLDRGVSVFNVKGFAPKETLMWITHGYGYCMPVYVREVYVADDTCFQVDWVESHLTDQDPIDFEIRTERLDVGQGGISLEALAEYLDKHIDGPFEAFIDDHFEGTPFVTEILKTAHRYYKKEDLPIIRKALKLVLAYNLTLKITMIEQPPAEVVEGYVDDEDSKFFGKTVAPVMINFQIKCAMADMWRELQKEILEELSALYSSVYSGDRLKNWPTIFMLASILLAVWEEMQFDCHYRVPDPAAVNKFCQDMEQTPVGVIVGLFHAISQKLPSFTEWDTRRHGHLLNNNTAVCEAMTEVRQHVIKHEAYLKTRQEPKFDRYDFDSLSNKFLAKLVIRA